MVDFLTEAEARYLVEQELKKPEVTFSTDDILKSGEIPELYGFFCKPGKVSDSIFGGSVSYKPTENTKVTFINPKLVDKNGTPIRIMVRTNRISTHDIKRGEIPFKDQILALNHDFMRRLVMSTIGTSQYEVGLPAN